MWVKIGASGDIPLKRLAYPNASHYVLPVHAPEGSEETIRDPPLAILHFSLMGRFGYLAAESFPTPSPADRTSLISGK